MSSITKMIPKIIHYCWFGPNELSPLHIACIETWKEKLPDFQIKRWDESNIEKNDFIEFHLENENWAFVSDFVRLQVLYKYGGIYLDTDFEVVRDFTPLLENHAFLAFQDSKLITNGIAGSAAGQEYFSACMQYMEERHNKGLPYHISPIVTTETLKQQDYGVTIYPKEYFYPYNPYDENRPINVLMYKMVDSNCFAIHHWAKSWEAPETEFEFKKETKRYLLKLYKFLTKKL